jgi:hypothetical protein
MLFREIIAVYCENHMEHTNTFCAQNADLFKVPSENLSQQILVAVRLCNLCAASTLTMSILQVTLKSSICHWCSQLAVFHCPAS